MRYTPAALALSLLTALTASAGQSAPPVPLNPSAAALVSAGRSALAAGQTDEAVSDFEAALAVQPGHAALYLNLAEATRKQGLTGRALHYYRTALALEPDNQYAIAGEGVTLAQKGAIEKAKRDLARLEQVCGASCPASGELAAAIAQGPAKPEQVVSADAVASKPVVTAN